MAQSYHDQLEAMTDQELLEEAIGRLLHWVEGMTPEQAKEEVLSDITQPPDEWEPPAVTLLRKRLQGPQ